MSETDTNGITPIRSLRDGRIHFSAKQKRFLAVQRRCGGRPPKWADGETLHKLVQALRDPLNNSKAAAARAAGIGYATLARWQAAHPELHGVWEHGRHARYRRRQAAVAARAALRPTRPTPTKQMRLICWFLVFRVHPEHQLAEVHEQRACERVKMSWERWQAACEQFPKLMDGVRRKRARRLAYLYEKQSIGLNYCPPPVGKSEDRRYPVFALYHWTKGNTFRDMAGYEQAQSPRKGQIWL